MMMRCTHSAPMVRTAHHHCTVVLSISTQTGHGGSPRVACGIFFARQDYCSYTTTVAALGLLWVVNKYPNFIRCLLYAFCYLGASNKVTHITTSNHRYKTKTFEDHL